MSSARALTDEIPVSGHRVKTNVGNTASPYLIWQWGWGGVHGRGSFLVSQQLCFSAHASHYPATRVQSLWADKKKIKASEIRIPWTPLWGKIYCNISHLHTTRKQCLWRTRNHKKLRDEETLKSLSLSRCMFCNTFHLLQSPLLVSAQDMGFLYCIQSKHIQPKHRANHNIFSEQPFLTADGPYTCSPRESFKNLIPFAAPSVPGDKCSLKYNIMCVPSTAADLCNTDQERAATEIR